MFISERFPGEKIIDEGYDGLAEEFNEDGDLLGKGHIPRDYSAQPIGSIPFTKRFDLPIIPRGEWADRIEEKERNNSRLTDIVKAAGLTVKNQGSTNYCWINSPIFALEIMRVVQNEPMVRLSPASCGAIIKNFRNVGGWGTEGLEFLVQEGAVPSEDWPDNSIDRRHNTPDNNDQRPRYRVKEWFDIPPRRFEILMTLVLQPIPIPCCLGLNWWRHEVTGMDGVILDGQNRFGIRIGNSWGTGWGAQGYGILTEPKATPDDIVAPTAAIPS